MINSVSLNQERILLERHRARLAAATEPFSHLRFGLNLQGILDGEHLRAVLHTMIARHTALTTAAFENKQLSHDDRKRRLELFLKMGLFDPGLFLQTVEQKFDVDIRVEDLTPCDPAQRTETIHDLVNSYDTSVFAAEQRPKMRAHLIKKDTDSHLLLIYLDHLFADGLSLDVCRRDFCSIFGAGDCFATPPGLNKCLSFQSFVEWQNRTLQTSYFDNSIAFWRRQWSEFAGGRIAFEEFPFSESGLQSPEEILGTKVESFDENDVLRLRNCARSSKTTLFVMFLAAYSILLRAYTNKSVLAVWCHLANRVLPGTAGTVGLFKNSHILGVEILPGMSGTDLIAHLRRIVAQAIVHQEMPLEHLWTALRCIPRDGDAAVLIDFRTTIAADHTVGDLKISSARLPPICRSPRFSAFGLYIVDEGDRLSTSVQYLTSRFRESGVQEFLRQLKNVCMELALHPERPVARLKCLEEFPAGRTADSGHLGEFTVLPNGIKP